LQSSVHCCCVETGVVEEARGCFYGLVFCESTLDWLRLLSFTLACMNQESFDDTKPFIAKFSKIKRQDTNLACSHKFVVNRRMVLQFLQYI
jgi:hypothetical protein